MLAAEDNAAAGAVIALVLFVIIAWACVGGLVGWAIAKGKGRGVAGFWLGLLLGWIGWIIAACLSPSAEVQARRMAMTHAHLFATNAAMRPRYMPLAPMPPVSGAPAGWLPDPLGRFEHRYWNGAQWTEHVARQGQTGTDYM